MLNKVSLPLVESVLCCVLPVFFSQVKPEKFRCLIRSMWSRNPKPSDQIMCKGWNFLQTLPNPTWGREKHHKCSGKNLHPSLQKTLYPKSSLASKGFFIGCNSRSRYLNFFIYWIVSLAFKLSCMKSYLFCTCTKNANKVVVFHLLLNPDYAVTWVVNYSHANSCHTENI